MRVGTVTEHRAVCMLCSWDQPRTADSDQQLRDHLKVVHSRWLITTEERDNNTVVYSGPRWSNEL
jgi:hypothetical protein